MGRIIATIIIAVPLLAFSSYLCYQFLFVSSDLSNLMIGLRNTQGECVISNPNSYQYGFDDPRRCAPLVSAIPAGLQVPVEIFFFALQGAFVVFFSWVLVALFAKNFRVT